jgi:hypothetical protein
MGQRVDLHQLLQTTTGLSNIYFQPPSSISLNFPCVIYAREGKDEKFADNELYLGKYRYSVTVVSSDPDSQIPESVAGLPFTKFDRRYVTDSLYHDVFSTYF